MGKRRIVGLLDKRIEERARRGWSAAFLVHHPLTDLALEFLAQKNPENLYDLAPWIRQRKPDAIVANRHIVEILFSRGWTPPQRSTIILLDWTPNPHGFGGIDQCERVIATNAVDLVAGQLQHNERGIPEHVKMLLFAGHWVSGK